MISDILGGMAIVLIIFVIIGIIPTMLFLTVDWTTGQHGRLTITSVDKNLFGTYTVYSRNSDSAYTSEMEEITYCIDSDNAQLAEIAKNSIGKPNSTLVYPEKRIGFYFWDKCRGNPLKQIITQ